MIINVSGFNMSNSVAFTSNTDMGSTRVAFTNLEATDVIDTSQLKRNSLNLTTVQNLSDKLTVNASIKYSETREKGNIVMGVSTNALPVTFNGWGSSILNSESLWTPPVSCRNLLST